MSKIKLKSGGYIDLLDPNPADIHIEDIAHSLSKICRFGGHCNGFYSVAEHCMLAAKNALIAGDRDILREVLMHDASEAFLGDVVSPLKNSLEEYTTIEANMQEAIRLRFGLRDSPGVAERVKKHDMEMLVLEKRELFDRSKEKWPVEDEYEPAKVQIVGFHWTLAENSFLRVYKNIGTTVRRRTEPMEFGFEDE